MSDRGVAAPDARLKLAAGIAAPLVFTASWVIATIRQHGYDEYHVAREHISGLAAHDARHPRLMTAAFVLLGVGTNAFGAALRERLGGGADAGAGPRMIQVAGVAAVAAGLLRRDRMLLEPPDGVSGQSWRNDGHDLASGVIYAALVAAPVALARRFDLDAEHRALRLPALGTAALTAATMGVFASRAVEPYNGLVQRFGVSVPALASAGLAWRLLRAPARRRRGWRRWRGGAAGGAGGAAARCGAPDRGAGARARTWRGAPARAAPARVHLAGAPQGRSGNRTRRTRDHRPLHHAG